MADEASMNPADPGTTEPVNLAAKTPVPPAQPPVPPAAPVPSGATPGKLRSIGQLLKDSWKIFAASWLKYIIFMLIVIAIGLGGIVVGAVVFVLGLGLWNTAWFATVALFVVAGLALIYLFLSIGLATSKFLYGCVEGSSEGKGSALKYGLKNSLSFFWVSLVTGLIIIAAPLIVGIIFGIMAAVAGVNAGTIIVGLLLIIPSFIASIYLGTMLSFVTQNFVMEGNRGIAAIKRSWSLVKGSFWQVFGRIVVLGLIGIVISFLNQGTDNAAYFLLTSIYFVLNFIYSVVSVFYNYLIYKDLAQK